MVKIQRENRDMLRSFQILIERFANSTSTDDFFEALNNVYRDADQDPELKGWFSNMNTYIRLVNFFAIVL
jgi:non-ribosomal peptide synthetase component F